MKRERATTTLMDSGTRPLLVAIWIVLMGERMKSNNKAPLELASFSSNQIIKLANPKLLQLPPQPSSPVLLINRVQYIKKNSNTMGPLEPQRDREESRAKRRKERAGAQARISICCCSGSSRALVLDGHENMDIHGCCSLSDAMKSV